MELYALRLLLLNTAGPMSYTDLKKVGNDPPCTTFAQAAQKRGLLDSDENWKKVMQDAVNENMSDRKLIIHFAQLLYFQPPVEPEQMLDDFLNEMMPQPRMSDKIKKEKLLHKLEYYLSKFGSGCMYDKIIAFLFLFILYYL